MSGGVGVTCMRITTFGSSAGENDLYSSDSDAFDAVLKGCAMATTHHLDIRLTTEDIG